MMLFLAKAVGVDLLCNVMLAENLFGHDITVEQIPLALQGGFVQRKGIRARRFAAHAWGWLGGFRPPFLKFLLNQQPLVNVIKTSQDQH
ncbi:MAG: hypothetical protein K2N56_04770 [Oscillospiraceae bacterium]|nr:hypothetical protein [Oscillospiraceae bacterium]